MQLSFHVLDNYSSSEGMRGGDRILIEFLKRLSKDHRVSLYGWKNAISFLRQNHVDVRFVEWCNGRQTGIASLTTFARTIIGVAKCIDVKTGKNSVIYASTEMWPDVLPSIFMKLLNRNAILVASFYIFAPSPFSKDNPYRGFDRLKGAIFYLYQMPAYMLIKKFADLVLVTNSMDGSRFTTRDGRAKSLTVMGGIDIKLFESVPDSEKKIYDAIFIGHFHPQKGVLELIRIWDIVCRKKSNAQLAIIGRGELEGEIIKAIRKYKLEKNVSMLGFMDGIEKIRIIKKSRIIVHPAIYDSGGMAACEGMICKLPGVSFDLPALKEYYPKGMVKIEMYNLDKFAETILKLLTYNDYYNRYSREAYEWALTWDWNDRVNLFVKNIEETVSKK